MTDDRRLLVIDAMRFIGISLVILAHVLGPESILFQVRSFDVPLMVFVSGLVSARKIINSYASFVGRRLLRLIVPVWIFYTLDFLVIIILSRLGIEAAPSLREVVRTFLCIDGYGWIIRVFVLLAIVTPPLIQLEKRVTNTYMYYGILIGIMFLTAYLSTLVKQRESFWVSDVWEGCILSLLGYIPPYLAGLRMRFATVKERFVFVLVFAIASIAIYIFPGIPFAPEQFKYPPQIPFIVYGIATSSLIWWCQPLLRLLTKSRLLVFIGQNTIWIYLYHVLLLLFVFKICKIWWMQYFIVYGCSVLIFIVQYYLSRKSNKVLNKYLVG